MSIGNKILNCAHLNIARIANAVQCHSLFSDNKDFHKFRFSIVSIVISVSNVVKVTCL